VIATVIGVPVITLPSNFTDPDGCPLPRLPTSVAVYVTDVPAPKFTFVGAATTLSVSVSPRLAVTVVVPDDAL
jgi:hypothetical protein